MPRTMQRISCSYFLFSFILLHSSCSAWVAITPPRSCSTRGCPLLHSSTLQSQQQQQQQRYSSLSSSSNTRLYATSPQQTNDSNSAATTAVKTKKQSRASLLDPDTDNDDGETPAGIEGAQFFGGNKQKEEFFDPVAEAQATVETLRTTTTYARFQDRLAFTDDKVAAVAASLQEMFNQVLYEGTNNNNNNISVKPEYKYANDKNLNWKTPFPVQSTTSTSLNNNPLTELESALGFYRRLDVAITSGETVRSGLHDDNNNNNEREEALESLYKIRWEISVAWPTFWEPRILLTGTSLLTVQEKNRIITSQVDELDGGGGSSSTTDNLFSAIFKQWLPRFWDFYHIGMTPSAELLPKIQSSSSSFFSRYNRYELPPRLYLQPRQLDLGTRIDANAAIVPNHAFSCVIKTMGPTRQRYIPCSPVQVQILPTKQQQNQLLLQWSIPIAVECMTNAELAIPGPDEEALPESEPTCEYVFQPSRSVATFNYGGNPQDVAIADIRKKLYDLVIRDGLKPKLDDNGRPIFFFWQNTVKACYTDEGLGMVVYEWRPQFAKSNEVGIELEVGNSSK